MGDEDKERKSKEKKYFFKKNIFQNKLNLLN